MCERDSAALSVTTALMQRTHACTASWLTKPFRYVEYNGKLRRAGNLIIKLLAEQAERGEQRDVDAAMAQASTVQTLPSV